MDWRLISTFSGVGAYFVARYFGASVLVSIGIAVLLGVVIYAVARARRGKPPGPPAAA